MSLQWYVYIVSIFYIAYVIISYFKDQWNKLLSIRNSFCQMFFYFLFKCLTNTVKFKSLLVKYQRLIWMNGRLPLMTMFKKNLIRIDFRVGPDGSPLSEYLKFCIFNGKMWGIGVIYALHLHGFFPRKFGTAYMC